MSVVGVTCWIGDRGSIVQVLDETIKAKVKERLIALEDHFEAGVAFYYGSIDPGVLSREHF